MVAVGERYGRLVVVEELATIIRSYPSRSNVRERRVRALCDCGNETVTNPKRLVSGVTKSCGCARRAAGQKANAALLRHGDAANGKSTEYLAWKSMKQRCYCTSVTGFENYGGRGIRVCDHWLNSFENFLSDMGRKPSPDHSLDRIDNDGNYEPGNCRWSTRSEQALNRRTSRKNKAMRAA